MQKSNGVGRTAATQCGGMFASGLASVVSDASDASDATQGGGMF